MATLFLFFPSLSLFAQAVGDSIDIFHGQIVNNKKYIQGRDTLKAYDVVVSSTGYLKLSAPNGVVINRDFLVQSSGMLEINGGKQCLIRYTYDGSGNVLSRKKE